jgi:hypothetical protein
MDEIPPEATQYTDCSISTIHHTLQAPRRRLTIAFVAHRAIVPSSVESEQADLASRDQIDDDAVSVRQLAKEIVAIEDDVSVEAATGDAYHNVYTALIQTHLPKLDDVAAVEYNPDRKTVAPDQNLLALSMVAAITSPVAQMLFHDAVAKLYDSGSHSLRTSIDD